MKNQSNFDSWLKRAKSNLDIAKGGKLTDDIMYEDLCYECQQSAEKSLKGLLVFLDAEFPYTHSIGKILELIDVQGIDVPEIIKYAVRLTDYALITRYPASEEETISEEEYIEALKLAEQTYDWVKSKLKE